MSVSVHSSSFVALAPLETLTLSSTSEGVKLDHDLRKLYEEFEPHRPTLGNLWERVDKLLTWGTAWPDYDAPPPSSATIDLAHQWITGLYLDVLHSGRTWIDPLITANEEGEAMFEWQRHGRRLTIRVSEGGATYSKIWGTRPNLQFEEGIVDTSRVRQDLWAWLGS